MSGKTIKIGLTGGIGSGKSEVARMLAQLGATVIAADRLGHAAYLKGTPGYDAVVAEFGETILAPDGEVDRRALGRTVFRDASRRRRLENIVWPEIRRLTAQKFGDAEAAGYTVAVLEAAVLFEAGWEDLFDWIWTVEAPADAVVARLVQNVGLSEEEARSRMAAQLSSEERSRRSDLVIWNDAGLAELNEKVCAAWDKLHGS